MNQWGLIANTSNQNQARENAQRAKWRLAEYKWREFDWTNHDVRKKNQTNQSKYHFSFFFYFPAPRLFVQLFHGELGIIE